MMKYVVILLATIMSGCTTIHFDNGSPGKGVVKTENWHHNVALALVEVSAPVELNKQCENNEWTSVQTQQSFLNGLSGGVVNAIAMGLPIWYPKTVTTSCAE